MKKHSDKMKNGVYRFRIKNGKDGGTATPSQNINFPKSGNDSEENDINLMMIFGMEKEARYKNPEKFNKVKRDVENSKTANGKQEYLGSNQNGEFNAEYARKIKGIKVKMVFAFLLFACCVAFEYIVRNDSIVSDFLFNYSPVVISLFALQLLLMSIALGYKQYFSGFAMAESKRASGIVFTVLSTACFVYYTVMCVMLAMGKIAFSSGMITNFYLPVVSFCMFVSMFEDLNHVKREWKSFSVVSDDSGFVKYTLDKNSVVGGKKSSYTDRRKSMSVKKTEFVSGFVGRNEKGLSKNGSFVALILISVVVSLGLAVYRYVVTGNVLSAFSSLITSLVFTLPFSAVVTFSLGFKNAVYSASEKGCTVVGLRTFEELQSVSAVYFDDLAVFPPSGIRLKGFKAYGNNRIDKSLYVIASIYKKIDAPPANMFISAVGQGEQSESVDIIDVSPRGIHAVVDDLPVYMGGADYITECGFSIPEGVEDEPNPNVSTTFVVISGSVAMKLYIEYSLDPKIYSHVESLRKYGIYLGICTCDPNINDVMMNKRISLAKYPIGILKSVEDKASGQIASDINSGIVSNKGTAKLLSTLLLCINTIHSVKTDMIVKYFSLAAGILISFLVTFFSVEGYIASWFVILYQIFWLIPSVLIAKFGPRS